MLRRLNVEAFFFFFNKGPNSKRSPTIEKDERERKWKEVISQMGQRGKNDNQKVQRHTKR